MKYNPEKHHRRSIRLKGYDYSQSGLYFVTICTWQREYLFGEVVESTVKLSRFGEAVQYNWNLLPSKFEALEIDKFVIMPNHIHGIIHVGAGLSGVSVINTNVCKPAPTLFEIVRNFKTSSARRINQLRGSKGVPVWQRNYYEHIVRDENSLEKIREYISNNPLMWEQDTMHSNYPSNTNTSGRGGFICRGGFIRDIYNPHECL